MQQSNILHWFTCIIPSLYKNIHSCHFNLQWQQAYNLIICLQYHLIIIILNYNRTIIQYFYLLTPFTAIPFSMTVFSSAILKEDTDISSSSELTSDWFRGLNRHPFDKQFLSFPRDAKINPKNGGLGDNGRDKYSGWNCTVTQ